MEINVKPVGGAFVATLVGVLNEESRNQFDELLHPLVVERGQRLVLDLSGVPRTTSLGLGQLVSLVARANSKGATVVLAAPSPFMRSVLGVTRLDKFFVVMDSVETALGGSA
jgi:anti-anti-sigma factor